MEDSDKESCHAVHQESHGGTPCNIIEVSEDEFNIFSGKGIKNKNDLTQTLSRDVDAGFRTLLLINTTDFIRKYLGFRYPLY